MSKIDHNLICDLIERYDIVNPNKSNQEKSKGWQSLLNDYNEEKATNKTVKQLQDSWYGHLTKTRAKLSKFKASSKKTGILLNSEEIP